MASTQTTTSSYTPQGINEGNIAYSRAIVPANMTIGQTLSVTVPPGQDPGLIPLGLYFPSVRPSAIQPQIYGPGVTVVSHDTVAGVTVLSVVGSLALNDEIIMEFLGGE
jgi:hypothetical protein